MLLVPNFPVEADGQVDLERVAQRLGLTKNDLDTVKLVRRSLDARWHKPRWLGVLQVTLKSDQALGPVVARAGGGVRPWTDRDSGRYGLDSPVRPQAGRSASRPIVIGAGPAGLFAALLLAESGTRPILLERGAPTEPRVRAVNAHWRRLAPLDPDNNLLFGEGGAGTFSDGKIYTRRRDGELGYIFQRLISFGAPQEVLQESYAHLGTDRIRALLPPFRERLIELGAEVRFGARVADLVVDHQRVRGVTLHTGEVVEGGPVFAGVGHSARDSVRMLLRAGARAEARAISVGARVEHPQEVIDRARYGAARGAALPPASYRLTWSPPGSRAAHTFCMCPGGMVVPAAERPGLVVVNGMSFAARRAYWANSAVIVQVQPEDYARWLPEHDPQDPAIGHAWQEQLEARAFHLGQAGGLPDRAPAQRVVDLLADRATEGALNTSFPLGVHPTHLGELLPTPIVEGMRAALRAFDRELPGFAGEEAVLIAPESRTTSPITFLRDEGYQALGVSGLYPIGEGAGHAGGIISSALDGLRAARAWVAQHATPG